MDGSFAFYTFTGFFVVGYGFFLPAAVFFGKRAGRIRSWRYRKALNEDEIIKAEYSLLKEYGPIELGFMYDGKIDDREIIAGIARLLQAGKIERSGKGYLVIDSSAKDLTLGESVLLRAFDNIKSVVTFNELRKIRSANLPVEVIGTQYSKTLLNISREIEMIFQTQPMFNKFYDFKAMWKGIIKRSKIIGILLVVAYLPFIYQAVQVPSIESGINFTINDQKVEKLSKADALFTSVSVGLVMVILIIPQAAFVMFRYYREAGQLMSATEEIKKLWIHIEGFRWFLEITEFDNLEHELKENYNSENKLLPYAIALDQRNRFHKYFK